ncbi:MULTISPECIES: glycosyl hydrolase family 28 protein [unclassified Arcicella]|uniref:glycoside hydrolase family 28 protein n=1 Tax=unclassified Arcicella TaxID=2644986 RepID=UPI002861C8FD|nr:MULTISPECIES: glycosyl hydrolase family 28 protein [unclassified Arcicella]MDR6562315.1 polygalacturonase [Arcicella sp. BE51]MDR6811990.1 polygalacturonase [Arcicella sp. BE140]MDR6823301.1 polygalacturonase [Arcicella sp. BE139]
MMINKKNIYKLIFGLLALILSKTSFGQSYNILNFGAKTDTTFLNTQAIQSAIDKCHSQGGGEVVVPAGRFFTGTVLLKTNVYLKLSAGAVLQGSYNPADYPEYNILAAKKYGTITHNGLYVETMKALVIADNAHHIGILGEGTLKGAGEAHVFQLGINKDGKPKNIFFMGCKDVILKDFDVLNAAQVCISISGCERVLIDGIYLRTLVNFNNDGLDIDANDTTISNCIIDSEDDALCFKSEYLDKFCENITVTNCVLYTPCNGIKLGTGSRTGFRNISVNNCVIKKPSVNQYRRWTLPTGVVYQHDIQSVNTGIVIQGVDGGIVENISFSDIVMTDVLSPIFIRVGKRFLNSDGKPSIMRHLNIKNIRAESRSIIPSIIAGLEESPVEDVRLSNISIVVPIGVSSDFLKTFPAIVPEDTKGYPENRSTFGLKIPASAFYIRHAKGIVLNDISVKCVENEVRPAFYMDDAKVVRLKNVIINDIKIGNNRANVFSKNSEKIEVID